MAYTSIGTTVGVSLGPTLGGVLTHFLGWRSIFWFLAILAGIMIVVIILFQPETCRAVVGNGSLPPQPWNQPLLRPRQTCPPDVETRTTFSKRPRILDSVKLLLDKQIGQLILVLSLMKWGIAAVMISIPMLMEEKYHFNALEIGLCYVPYAVGSITARWTVGFLADWNFRRYGRQMDVNIERNRQSKEQLSLMPLEKVRLQITLPAIYCSSLFLLGYSWVLAYNVHLSGPLIMLFFLGNAAAGVTNTAEALVMDLHAHRPGMARAAVSLCGFLPGAGVVAIVPLLIQTIGFGWLGTIIAGLWSVSSAMLWVVYFKGQEWRQHGGRE
jgi:MFS family permease